jgi:hypothetical protein
VQARSEESELRNSKVPSGEPEKLPRPGKCQPERGSHVDEDCASNSCLRDRRVHLPRFNPEFLERLLRALRIELALARQTRQRGSGN